MRQDPLEQIEWVISALHLHKLKHWSPSVFDDELQGSSNGKLKVNALLVFNLAKMNISHEWII